MKDWTQWVNHVTADEISVLSVLVLNRYRELFPEWEIVQFSINKNENYDQQIDHMIRFLEGLRRCMHDRSALEKE